jgi:hypothetical protein
MRTGKSINSILAGKLDKLALPVGAAFRKEKSWEKLQLRLNRKKRKEKKKAFIFGLSAPVAAAAFYFLVWPGNDKTGEKINHPITITPNVTTTASKSSSMLSEPAISISPGKRTKTAATANKHAKEIKLDEADQIVVMAPSTIQNQDTAVASHPAVTMPLAQRKWRVVHNNELRGPRVPVADERNVVATVSRPRFILGFRTQGLDGLEDMPDDTIRKHKPKLSILPFGSFVSQKQ